MRRERAASPVPSSSVAQRNRPREQIPETKVNAGMPSRLRYMYVPLASAYTPKRSGATSGWHHGLPPASLSSTLLKKSWNAWLNTTAHMSQNLQLSRCASLDVDADADPPAVGGLAGDERRGLVAAARLDVRHGPGDALYIADTALERPGRAALG